MAMTKTKRQLRAEAVERLRQFPSAKQNSMLFAMVGHHWWSVEEIRDALIELLTDDDSTTESLSDRTDSREKSGNAVFVDGVQVFPPKALEHMADSRDKLEADVLESVKKGFITYETLIEWLDRQAAITERECMERATSERVGWDCAECAEGLGKELLKRVQTLTAERDELGKACTELREELRAERGAVDACEGCAKVDELVAEREMWRSRLGEAARLCAEAAALADGGR